MRRLTSLFVAMLFVAATMTASTTHPNAQAQTSDGGSGKVSSAADSLDVTFYPAEKIEGIPGRAYDEAYGNDLRYVSFMLYFEDEKIESVFCYFICSPEQTAFYRAIINDAYVTGTTIDVEADITMIGDITAGNIVCQMTAINHPEFGTHYLGAPQPCPSIPTDNPYTWIGVPGEPAMVTIDDNYAILSFVLTTASGKKVCGIGGDIVQMLLLNAILNDASQSNDIVYVYAEPEDYHYEFYEVINIYHPAIGDLIQYTDDERYYVEEAPYDDYAAQEQVTEEPSYTGTEDGYYYDGHESDVPTEELAEKVQEAEYAEDAGYYEETEYYEETGYGYTEEVAYPELIPLPQYCQMPYGYNSYGTCGYGYGCGFGYDPYTALGYYPYAYCGYSSVSPYGYYPYTQFGYSPYVGALGYSPYAQLGYGCGFPNNYYQTTPWASFSPYPYQYMYDGGWANCGLTYFSGYDVNTYWDTYGDGESMSYGVEYTWGYRIDNSWNSYRD